MLVGAPRNAVRAFNAGVSLSCLYGHRPQAATLALRRGVVRSAFPLRGKAVMAHPPSGSVQGECVRSCPMLRRRYLAPLSLSRNIRGCCGLIRNGKGVKTFRYRCSYSALNMRIALINLACSRSRISSSTPK